MRSAPATVTVVSVGNELLSGQTIDTNAAWLGRTFASEGLPVLRRFTVADDDDAIREAVASALALSDIVCVSGGLGPTPDDRTKAAVAELLDRDLVHDEGVADTVRARFRSQGMDVPERSLGQSLVPEGSEVLANEWGTAPGLLIGVDARRVVLLPGVPRELRGIVEHALLPRLRADGVSGSGRHHFVVHTTGRSEPVLAEGLEARLAEIGAELLEGVEIAYLPDHLGVDLRFTISDPDPTRAAARFDALRSALGPVLDGWAFESPDGVAEALLAELRASGRTIAVAESCTGGLVGKRLTDRPGASDVVLGGVIAYANAVKVEALGVSDTVIADHGAVSEQVAEAMARGAADRFGADTSVAVTGVAGPGGGTDEKPVGTVWMGCVVDGDVVTRLGRFPGDRDSVRTRAAQAALALLYRRLKDDA